MEDLIIVGGLILGVYLLKKHLDANAAAPVGVNLSIPTALGISTAPTTSAAYQTAPSGTQFLMGYTSQSSGGTVPAPPPVPPPSPAFFGGLIGSVGAGGNPLGGSLRAGVSAGTGTTLAPGGTTMYDFATGKVSYRAPIASVNPDEAYVGKIS